jgi:subfamily B ATP-binding cassette protein MsbA
MKPYANKHIKTVVKYLRKYKKALIFGCLVIIFQSLLILPTPLITRHIIDDVIPGKDFKLLLILIAAALSIHFIQRYMSYFQEFLFFRVNAKMIYDIRVDLLKKVNRIPMKLVKKYGTGYLISRINDDTERIRSLFADTMTRIFIDVLTLIVGVVAIYYLNWKLATMTILVVPSYIMTVLYFTKIIKKKSRTYYEEAAQTTKQLEESLNMVELGKLFLRYNFSALRYVKNARKSFYSYLSLGRISLKNTLYSSLITGLAPVVVLGYGVYEIMEGRFTIGSLMAFNAYVMYLFGPAGRLIMINVEVQKALVALGRIEELFALPSERHGRNGFKTGRIDSISLKNVSFSYDRTPVLQNLSMDIMKGEKIAIVGGSGNGKTTLLRILTGLYPLSKGTVSVNKKQLSKEEMIGLRKYTAVIEQEPFLFNDTIFNNIKFGNPRARDEDVYEAACKAHVDEFVGDSKEGYQRIVGNKGSNLSVGQKQRITIARALLRKPRLLILDEATSNIDSISEAYINKTIFSLPDDVIVIIIAHRLSTIKNCDRIFVIQDGNITESGTHDQLVAVDCGVYKKYYESSVH